ncbi:MAG: hypothetical protein H7Y38_19100 [Armatimonadetes bacterium]|nr:hypothetical protein [Armatimonadota bacterium]
MARRSFSSLRTKDAFDLVPIRDTTVWDLRTDPLTPSDVLLAVLQRTKSFALSASEAAKVTLIDSILMEILPKYPGLRAWKDEPLETGNTGGVVDYLIAPSRGYIETPLLCAVEARLDDFTAGEIQCVAEMAACRDNNARDGHDLETHGTVSNGQGWVFYRLTRTPEVFVSSLFTMNDLPKLLGALDHVIAACADNIP